MVVKVKKLVPDAVLPKKAHKDDAGYDLVAVSRVFDENGAVVYGTGLAFEIPEGYVGLVFPRSSVAKKDVILTNCVGVIDAGYRGELTAKFKPVQKIERGVSTIGIRNGFNRYDVGDRIAQIVFMKLPDVQLVESDELGESERGTGGYGSSGK